MSEHVGIALEVGTAVEVEHLAGQPGRLRRADEYHGVGDLFGFSGPAERGVLEVVLHETRYGVGPLGQRRIDQAGRDSVDANTPWPHLERGNLGEHRDARL